MWEVGQRVNRRNNLEKNSPCRVNGPGVGERKVKLSRGREAYFAWSKWTNT